MPRAVASHHLATLSFHVKTTLRLTACVTFQYKSAAADDD